MDSCRTWHESDPALGAELRFATTGAARAARASLPADAGAAAQVVSLASLHKGARGHIAAIASDAGSAVTIGDVAHSTVARRLIELGFVPGEPIEIVMEVWPGGDPMAVRVGASVFALRRREAQAVLVTPCESVAPMAGEP